MHSNILCNIYYYVYNRKLIYANKITVLWHLTTRSSADRCRHFGETSWLHLQGRRKVVVYIVTDLINALPGNSSINTVQLSTEHICVCFVFFSQ
jgi:hypothetical protein